jgi:hypothetical protein
VTTYTDDDERRLKVELMIADIDNKRADTEYKHGLLRWEPWRLVITAVAAGGVIGGALVGGLSYLGRQPTPIVIQLPPAK